MPKEKIFLIDAHSFCYRAFYAIKGLSNSKGQPTGAVYGFLNILNKIVKENSPDYLAVCFDVGKKTFRTEKFKDYKINRPSMPDDLSSQMPLIKEVVRAYNYRIFEKEGFEADDLLATLAENLAKENNVEVFLVSADKDILQMADKNIKVFNPYKDSPVFGAKEVKEKYGLAPEKIVDMMALMGDSSDNIPGVPGVGEKTALKLLKQFGTLEKVLSSADKISQNKLRESIEKFKGQALLSRELATLDRTVPLKCKLKDLKVDEPDKDKLIELFSELEFRAQLKELLASGEKIQSTKVSNSQLKEILKGAKEISFLITADDDVAMNANILSVEVGTEKKICATNELKGLKAYFEDEKIKKATHDLKFAKIVLKNAGIEIRGECFDTYLAAYCLKAGEGAYDLEALRLEYMKKLTGSNALLDLKEILIKELKKVQLDNLFYNVEMPLVSCLCEIELNGVSLDLKLLAKFSKELDERITGLTKKVYKLASAELNLNSPKQLREILFEKLKLKPVKKTKTGPSTDEESLRKLAKHHEIIPLLLEYRELSKLKSTYIDALPNLINKKTGKIHTSFNQAKTSTGRLSSSNPNLQNIPIRTELGRSVRRAFVPAKKGDSLLSADYSQIELRVLAHISGDENLIKAFRNGRDIHTYTASLIFGIDEDEVSREERDTAKRINFGIIYGISSYGLSKDLGIDVMAAQEFIDAYFLRYPKVKEYMDETLAKVRKEEFVTTLLERRRYLPQINSKNRALQQFAYRQAINAPIQGTAADMIKLAMIRIHEDFLKAGFEAKMVLQVHDELVFEVPQKEMDEVINTVRQGMENVLELAVPIKVDMKQGKNWLDMEVV